MKSSLIRVVDIKTMVAVVSVGLSFACQGAEQQVQSSVMEEAQVQPTTRASARPSPAPSASPSARPSATPSSTPSPAPSPSPTRTPTPAATPSTGTSSASAAAPTAAPSAASSSSSASSRETKRLVYSGPIGRDEYRYSVGSASNSANAVVSEEGVDPSGQYFKRVSCGSGWVMTGFDIGYNDWNWVEDSISYFRLHCRDANHYSGGSFESATLGVDGSGVDTDKSYQCDSGEFMTGIQGRTEDYILAARPRCGRAEVEARIYSDGSRTHSLKMVDRNYPTAMYNRSQSDDRDQLAECEGENVMVGMRITYKKDGSEEAAITRIRPVCASFRAVKK